MRGRERLSPPAAGLVLATSHSPALAFLRPTGDAAAALLAGHGSGPALALFDEDATQPDLHLGTRHHGRRYDIAFACCAGAAGLLFNYVSAFQVVLMDGGDRSLFEQAIVLLCCPVWDPGFATSLAGTPEVEAVIGFDPKLRIPEFRRIPPCATPVSSLEVPGDIVDAAFAEYREALLAPLRALMTDPDVGRAVRAGQDRWLLAHSNLLADWGTDAWRFAWDARANARALRSW